MKSRTTRRFREHFARLSSEAQEQAREAYRRFQSNPQQPGLRFKRIRDATYAVRISRDYRALGVLTGDEIIWFWIGRHDEYESILRSL